MFTTLTTGLSGLMKVAQEKMIVPAAESEESAEEKTHPTAPGNADDVAAAPKDTSAAPEQSKEGKVTGSAPEGAADATSAAPPAAEGENILGAAKEWGNFLFGGVKDVTLKVSSGAANATEAFTSGAQMLKKTVEENTILGDFNRQQEKFVEDHKETHAAQEAALPPWMGYAEDEENLKEQILALSTDERHFMRPPPGGVSYQFDYGTSYPIALATLEADPMLREMRFKLVPKKIKEEDFWRNYFYRVSLIKQSVALHSMSNEEDATSAAAAGSVTAHYGTKPDHSAVTADGKNNADEGGKAVSAASAEETSVGDVADEMNAIGDEEEDIPEWEKELQRELQEYEVVGETEDGNEVTPGAEESEEWQEEIQKMLEQANVDDSPAS